MESKQYAQKSTNYDQLKKQVRTAIKDQDYKKVALLTKETLSLDYTSLFAHKYLRQTYKILGDYVNEKKYHDIEFGLLNSILKSGDGKTCATGWHVTQIEEEYFILGILETNMKSQSLMSVGKNACDKMDVTSKEGSPETYYFEINKVLAQENKMFNGK